MAPGSVQKFNSGRHSDAKWLLGFFCYKILSLFLTLKCKQKISVPFEKAERGN
jgi:hypothetical protein